MLAVIRGAGDIATGIALRLHRAGIGVAMLEVAEPTTIRRTVAFSEAVRLGACEVEGVTARLVQDAAGAVACIGRDEIPVLVDPLAATVPQLAPDAVVDAILAKRNLGTRIDMAPVVVGVGPGFTAGVDCHAAVETMRGHYLGRVHYEGSPLANTGVPGLIGGFAGERVMRAPADGTFSGRVRIGDTVAAGDVCGEVSGVPMRATIGGTVRGLLADGVRVHAGMKAGDVDPRCEPGFISCASDKALAVGGGVLEALRHVFSRGRNVPLPEWHISSPGENVPQGRVGRAVIARVLETRGSMPRGAGAWLALSEDGRLAGSIGGGALEHRAIERARAVLAGAPGETRWHVHDETGMACGGDALVDIRLAAEGELAELLAGAVRTATPAFIYGAGHVGAALVELLPALGFSATVVDDRPAMATAERLPGAARIACGSYADLAALDALPGADGFAVVLTHGHEADIDVLDQILPCRPAYVGCIGSRRKSAIARDELVRRGHDQGLVDAISMPIGEDIGADTPAEIAVSIAAQLIRARAEQRGDTP